MLQAICIKNLFLWDSVHLKYLYKFNNSVYHIPRQQSSLTSIRRPFNSTINTTSDRVLVPSSLVICMRAILPCNLCIAEIEPHHDRVFWGVVAIGAVMAALIGAVHACCSPLFAVCATLVLFDDERGRERGDRGAHCEWCCCEEVDDEGYEGLHC